VEKREARSSAGIICSRLGRVARIRVGDRVVERRTRPGETFSFR
jgi:hypothetical protein